MENKIFNYEDPNNKFWKLIDSANGDQKKFYDIICDLPLDDLRAYKREFQWAGSNQHYEVIEKATPKELFDAIRLFIISQGYQFYNSILKNPSIIPSNITADNPQILNRVIEKVMMDKYIDELFNHMNSQNKFWIYIEQAEIDKDFYKAIWHMSLEELRDYEEEFDKADRKLDTNEHYEAMGNIRSEDSFDDTRRYVVSQGYNYYQDILKHPEKLPEGITDDNPKLLYGTIGRVMMDKYEDY